MHADHATLPPSSITPAAAGEATKPKSPRNIRCLCSSEVIRPCTPTRQLRIYACLGHSIGIQSTTHIQIVYLPKARRYWFVPLVTILPSPISSLGHAYTCSNILIDQIQDPGGTVLPRYMLFHMQAGYSQTLVPIPIKQKIVPFRATTTSLDSTGPSHKHGTAERLVR